LRSPLVTIDFHLTSKCSQVLLRLSVADISGMIALVPIMVGMALLATCGAGEIPSLETWVANA
jgi:hypothetical protein